MHGILESVLRFIIMSYQQLRIVTFSFATYFTQKFNINAYYILLYESRRNVRKAKRGKVNIVTFSFLVLLLFWGPWMAAALNHENVDVENSFIT